MSTFFLVASILLGIVVVNLCIWVPLLLMARKRSQAFRAELEAELKASGERLIIPPEGATYRGGTEGFSLVRGSGIALLTDQRLIFRKLIGERIDVQTSRITAFRDEKVWQGGVSAGHVHLVLETKDGELGFYFRDASIWKGALSQLILQGSGSNRLRPPSRLVN